MKSQNKKEFLKYVQEVASNYDVSQAKVGELFSDSVNKVLSKFLPDRVFKIDVDLETGNIVSQAKYVVVENLKDGDYDDFNEIPLEEANKYGEYKVGDSFLKDFDLFDDKNLPKQQIIQILQIFKQRLNEINNVKVYSEWAPRIGEIVTAEVEKNNKGGFYIINLENNNFGFLSKKEAIPGEELKPGSKYQFLIKDVKEHSRGWPIILSRADVNFVQKLLKQEIPEIATGEIEVNLIKRIPGFKTKIAVSNKTDSTYDPAAVVVGAKGARIKNLSSLINNEKIEVIKYSPNFKELLLNVCGQNNIVGYQIIEPKQKAKDETPPPATDELVEGQIEGQEATTNDENKPHVTLIVNEDVLPIIIGKKGFNIKLIAIMLNCSIDINTVEQANKLNLSYEKVVNTAPSTAKYSKPASSHAHNGERWSQQKFSQPSANFNNRAKASPTLKMTQSNDDLLEDINNLSEEEIKQLYDIDLDMSATTKDLSSTSKEGENTSTNSIDDYEDLDLSDAFADEIANAINKNDK